MSQALADRPASAELSLTEWLYLPETSRRTGWPTTRRNKRFPTSSTRLLIESTSTLGADTVGPWAKYSRARKAVSGAFWWNSR